MNKHNSRLCQCVERIEKWFWYDTVSFLDCVLADDDENPEFSANTAYNRLEEVVEFQKLYYNKEYRSVSDLLLDTGYTNEDIEILNRKRSVEV